MATGPRLCPRCQTRGHWRGAEIAGAAGVAIQEQLRKFWEIEEIDVPQSNKFELELEHRKCEEFVSQNIGRDETGRFVTINKSNVNTLVNRNLSLSTLKKGSNRDMASV